MHLNIRTEVLEGHRKKGRTKLPGNILILNYDILKSWLKVLLRAKPAVVIIDEAQFIKNPKALRTKATLKLAEGASSVLALSGTPLTNRPIELWPILKAVRPDLFPSFEKFAWRYCRPRYTHWGWRYTGSAREDELHRILVRECMIRRLKKEVSKELPPKIRRGVPFKLKSYVEYNNAEHDFLGWLRKKDPLRAKRAAKSQALTRVGYLLRLVARLKLDWTVRWIHEFFEAHPDKKLVCFTMHRFVIEHLMEVFGDKAVKIDGSVRGIKRAETVRKFQNNPRVKLFVGQWIAAGIGITLTAAHNTAALDFPWTPADLLQGEDRIHRIGQKNKCIIHYLAALGTIEEKLVKLLRKKARILDAILDGKRHAKDLDLFDELLREMKHL